VRRLMEVVRVDSYGACLRNREVRDLLGFDNAFLDEPYPFAQQKLEIMSRCAPWCGRAEIFQIVVCAPYTMCVQVPLHFVHRELALPGLRDRKVFWSTGLVHAHVVSWRAEYCGVCTGPKLFRGCAGFVCACLCIVLLAYSHHKLSANSAAFGTPEALGAHINAMDLNDTLYQSYFAWRAEGWEGFHRSAIWTREKPRALECELCERVHHVQAGCALKSGN
jgi:hypothetical protein